MRTPSPISAASFCDQAFCSPPSKMKTFSENSASGFSDLPANRAHDQTAEISFHFVQFWKRRPHAQVLRVAGIDAGNKRVDRLIQKFRSIRRVDKLGDRFMFRAILDRTNGSLTRRKECLRRKSMPLTNRSRPQRLELCRPQDVTLLCSGFAARPGLRAEQRDQLDKSRRSQQAVRPLLDRVAVLLIVWMLPPTCSDASKTVTSIPFFLRRNAVVRPEMPPPMTATFSLKRPLASSLASTTELFQIRARRGIDKFRRVVQPVGHFVLLDARLSRPRGGIRFRARKASRDGRMRTRPERSACA